MACKGFWECILKLLNFLLTISGLAMIGYGVYLLVEWVRVASGGDDSGGGSIPPPPPAAYDTGFWKMGRPMLLVVSLSDSVLDRLHKAWFIYLFIAELGAAAFIFFDHSWKDVMPTDQTGNFEMLYDFLKDNWKIAKWICLGVVILESLVFLLALIVRAANRPAEYDSDDEYIAPRSSVWQPLLINRHVGTTAVGAPVTLSLDQRPSRNDAWSQRMREKYGLDSSEFTYNPADPERLQGAAPPAEEKGRCTIL